MSQPCFFFFFFFSPFNSDAETAPLFRYLRPLRLGLDVGWSSSRGSDSGVAAGIGFDSGVASGIGFDFGVAAGIGFDAVHVVGRHHPEHHAY